MLALCYDTHERPPDTAARTLRNRPSGLSGDLGRQTAEATKAERSSEALPVSGDAHPQSLL